MMTCKSEEDKINELYKKCIKLIESNFECTDVMDCRYRNTIQNTVLLVKTMFCPDMSNYIKWTLIMRLLRRFDLTDYDIEDKVITPKIFKNSKRKYNVRTW